jgi:hypothetical protein
MCLSQILRKYKIIVMIRKFMECNNTSNKRARIENLSLSTYRLPLVPPWSKFTSLDVYVSRLIGEYLLPGTKLLRLDSNVSRILGEDLIPGIVTNRLPRSIQDEIINGPPNCSHFRDVRDNTKFTDLPRIARFFGWDIAYYSQKGYCNYCHVPYSTIHDQCYINDSANTVIPNRDEEYMTNRELRFLYRQTLTNPCMSTTLDKD